ncbi:hypothetical protein DICSQDRAFT_124643 [Dichomitus squalens LYAD-421 SS1]|uniref:uncharacterized protein n=1 Tax=Dichomitus squalens (strain LYAD-421) TaxID=732165 RepID=UPI0004415FD3|nr:uncharacterized protein DICSQDRAFT_124643 [Dichomitus squalens LYAD-421 SS1]EJF65480.1 hypothetical protein DICSQDRAFT_124643 [Dichomitus squalens LYAD-421 SS1]
MALGGLGAILLAGHPTHALGNVFSKVDLRSVFFAVVIVVIVLVLAYLTNPSETSFRTHLTELHIKEHIRQLEGAQDDSSASEGSAAHFTLSRRTPPIARKLGSNFDPRSPFHFVSRASVSLRTPKHVFQNFGILSIAAVYPPSRYSAQGNGHAAQTENLSPSVFDAWYIGVFGTWWRGGIVQSWWHEMLENTKERCGSGLLDIKALDVLEGFDGLPLPTSSRLPTEAPNKLRGTERSTQRSTSNAPRSTTPPPLPKSASLPLHAPRVPASTPPKGNGGPNQRHAPSVSAPVTPEQPRPPAPPMLAYSPSSTSLWDSSPIIAEVLRQISQSKAAVRELHSQLNDFRTVSSESRSSIQSELEAQRERKREEDAARAELKSRTKTLEDSRRSAESSKRDAEKRLRAAESARDNATARIEKLGEEIGVLRSRMRDDELAVVSCKEEGDVKEREAQETLEKKRKEIKVAEDVVAALNMRAKDLEEKIVQEEDRLRRAKEQAEIKKQDRSFYPLTVVPTVNEEDVAIPPWSSYGRQNQSQDSSPDSVTQHSGEDIDRQEAFPHPIQAPKSKGSVSSGSGSSDAREPSISPRPARLSLTAISNLREPTTRVLPEPDPNGQVLLRPRGITLLTSDLPTLSTNSTSTRFSPFGDSDGQEALSPADGLNPPSSISPSSFIPSSLIHSLDGAGGFDMNLSRSFQSEDDAVLSRDWRKNAPFPRPLPVESPGTGQYTTSPSSLTCPSFEGVDKEDPFEVRPLPTRRRLTSELMDLQRATLPPNRTISDPLLPPAALMVAVADHESQDKTGLAHRRWSSQQDAPGKERKGLNPEAKAFSLTKRTFPSLYPSPVPHPHAFDPLGPSPLGIPSVVPEPDGGNLFSSISMRAFAPSPAEREALKRALGGSTNASLERLPTLSEVSSVSSSIPSIPSLSLSSSSPSSPSHSHSHAHAVPAPPGLGAPAGLGLGMGVNKDASLVGLGLGTGRTLLGPSLSWLQNLPRGRKPKFSPWEDEETKELEVGSGGQ